MKVPTLIVLVDFFSRKLNLYNLKGRLAASVLNKKAEKCTTILNYVDLSFDIFHNVPSKYLGWPLETSQVKQEIQTLLSMLSERNVKTMLEIGTAQGGTLFLFTRMIDANAKIISLDLPHAEFGGGYENFKISFFTNFARKNQRIFLVRADSHSPSSLSTIKSILEGQKLDLLFIDGDHTYEGVKKDLQMYSSLVRKGGLIGLHDICKGSPERAGAVNKFWNEIRLGYVHKEIVNNSNQEGYGIGVLYI